MFRWLTAGLIVLMCAVVAADEKETKPKAGGDDGAKDEQDGWVSIWDGESMEGWKASENTGSWTIKDGALVCEGPRSHLFYVGDKEPFQDFEFQCEVMTTPGSNAGIYFHTKWQEEGWPKYGYECQVNITHSDPKKTGSLYGVVNVDNPPAKDGEWYTTDIRVEGRHIVIRINGETTVDYTEPEGKEAESKDFERRLGEGTFALQAHDPASVVYFRNLRVRRIEDGGEKAKKEGATE